MRNAIADRMVRPRKLLPGFHGHRAVLAAAVVGALSSMSWAAPILYRPVVLSGASVPDAAGSTTASLAVDSVFGPRASDSSTTTGFISLAINQSGRVAVIANLTNGIAGGTSVTTANSRGIWSEGADGVLRQTARQGDANPDSTGTGIAGLVYGSTFVGPNINGLGQTAFTDSIASISLGTDLITTTAAANNNGIYFNPVGATKMVLRKGTPAVGFASSVYQGVGAAPVMNSTGTMVVPIAVNPTSTFTSGTNSVYKISSTGVITKMESGGDLAPGTDLGSGTATYSAASGAVAGNPAINATGDIVFKAQLTSGAAGVTTSNDIGIWSTAGSGLHLVAREGGAAPGTASTFGNSLGGLSVGFNNAGYVAFSNTVAAGQAGIWKGSNTSNLSLVVLQGTPVSSSFVGVSGVTYSAFGTTPVINHDNYVAYTASFSDGGINIGTGINNTALFAEGPAGLRMVARAGDAAPGSTMYFSGTTASSAAISTSMAIQMNVEGAVAFLAALSPTQFGSSSATGLFAEDETGALRLVAQTGQAFDIAPGVQRTISSITYGNSSSISSGGEDGRVLAWTDSYQIAYQLRFTDGSSGVFVAMVPEPSSMGLLAGAGMLLLRRRRGR